MSEDTEKKPALPVGTQLKSNVNTYVIEQMIGSGGFGITYRASATVRVQNIEIDTYFAVKEHFIGSLCSRSDTKVVYSAPVSKQVEGSLKDFIAEARRLQKIGVSHPNIVRVNEVFEANNTAYYIMEYLEGQSLRKYVRQHGPLSEEATRRIMLPVIDAVAALHRARLTHLDIKPDNIMITERKDGSLRPVLIDFGLAKHYDVDGAPTSTINTLGCSAGYSPLEQYVGITSFSPASDVYALGATMLFCLSGADPLIANRITRADIEEAIPKNVSPAMRNTIIEAMAKSDADRLPSAEAMIAMLKGGAPFVAEIPEKKPAYDPNATELIEAKTEQSSNKWLRFAGICTLVAVVAATGAFFGLRGCGKSAAVTAVDSVAADTIAAEVEEIVEVEVAAEVEETDTPASEPVDEQPKQEAKPEPKPVAQEQSTDWKSLSRLENLALACERDGRYYYFSESNWRKIPAAEQARFSKKGVVVIGNGERFVLELRDSGSAMTWDEAMSRYGNRLPTKSQGQAMADNYEAINKAIIAFGGDKDPEGFYWTRTEYESDSSRAWNVALNYGGFYTNYKTNSVRVRAVAPVSTM